MSKFKLGDRVRLRRNHNAMGTVLVPHESFSGNRIETDWGIIVYCEDEQIELIPTREEATNEQV